MKKLILSATLAIAAVSLVAFAQNKPAGQTKYLSHAIHAVNDLDTTLAFYKDVLGINGTPQDFANAAVPLLTNAPGVTLRLSMVTFPGVRFELTHFKGLERKPAQATFTDPGAGSLILTVRDLDSVIVAAKKANAPIVTTGGAPLSINGKKSIVIRDPDGFFLQLVQQAPASGAPEAIVNGVTVAYTMEDAAKTLNFYNGMMALEFPQATAWAKDANYAKLVGAPENVEFRKITTSLPAQNGSPIPVEFTEFRGVPRTKFHLRVRDPGAPAMCIFVSNLEGMVAQMKGAGMNFLSVDQKIVDFGGGTFNIFVEDPNGLNIELAERTGAPGKGKGPAPQAK
jgi:catechol 2,3-dioxygenase-like lactoylglutathione lyase family enzyme